MITAGILAALMALDLGGFLLASRPDDLSRYDGRQVSVVRVISAHTLEIDLADEVVQTPTTRVRLWGVTAAPNDEALKLTQSLTEQQVVTLRLEPHRTRDAFDRVLAHVELVGGETINELLLEAGQAKVDESQPHRMLARYAQAQHQARRNGRGAWSDD